jgi:hypothetical protein
MTFNKEQHYKITKITAHDSSKPSRIPDDYWAIGTIEKEPEIEKILFMWRLANQKNPEGKLGYFATSTVKKVDKGADFWTIHTRNSIYKLEEFKLEEKI